jgi:hypothetical protein
MDVLFTTIALALPVLLGGLWLNLLVPQATIARTALVWSNGTLIGLLLLPQLMRVQDALAIPLSFAATGSLAGALMLVTVVVRLFRGKQMPTPSVPIAGLSSMPPSHQAAFIFLATLLALRCATLGLEILWRPLFPWDATMHWATKARVWFEFNRIVPFVENDTWLNLGGAGVFTDRHPGYPSTVPLLQVWMNLATGRWDESLMNLPWLLCLMALGGAFYSQLRVSGTRALGAIAFTYLLLSMPLLNIHVALAGYADLFLGAAYCAGLMAFHNWLTTRCRWQGLLAVFFALSCILVKNEGLLWSVTFLPALVVAVPTRHKMAKLLLLLVLGSGFLAVLALKNPVIVTRILGQLNQFHADGLTGTIKSVWLHDNWHLFGYLLLTIIPIGLIVPGALTRTYIGITTALACAVGLFLFVFLFTEFGAGASNFTGVGRLCIQLAPGLMFLCAMLWNTLLSRDSVSPSPGTAQLRE